MGLRGLLLLVAGVQLLIFADAQTDCSESLTTSVETIVEQLLGQLLRTNGISNRCDDTIKNSIDCDDPVQSKLTELNTITDITGQCLLYAIEYFDDTAENNIELQVACRFSDLQDACPDLSLNYAVHGMYGEWTEWTTCVSSTRSRSRSCENPSPANDGNDCSSLGEASETEDCDSGETTETTTGNTAQSQSHGTILPHRLLTLWLFAGLAILFQVYSN